MGLYSAEENTASDQGLSSQEFVREVASQLILLSEGIHHALQRLSSQLVKQGPMNAYELLTEEYALRARARSLKVDPGRFIVKSLPISQSNLRISLEQIVIGLEHVTDLSLLSEIIFALTLFANAICSRKSQIICYLFQELRELYFGVESVTQR